MAKDTVFAKIPQADDLEVHVKLTEIAGEAFVNIRDFTPSTKRYGRGVLFRPHQIIDVVEALQQMEASR